MKGTFSFLEPAPSRGDQARTRLLAAALELFSDLGPHGATVRAIARAAGQNVAAIAYYFGSKEKLYEAVLEGIVGELHGRMGDVYAEAHALRARGHATPAEAEALLDTFFRNLYLRMLSRSEVAAIGRLVVREQLKPTPGFEILYARGFRPLHEMLCHLVGVVLGMDPKTRETILRTHLLMGQAYFFTMSREAILRRLGWKNLEGEKAEWVADLLSEHLKVLLAGLKGAPPHPQLSHSKIA